MHVQVAVENTSKFLLFFESFFIPSSKICRLSLTSKIKLENPFMLKFKYSKQKEDVANGFLRRYSINF